MVNFPMIPLTHCPSCSSPVVHSKDDLSEYDVCRCSFYYILRFNKLGKPSYVNFHFDDFFAYIYFDNQSDNIYPSNVIHIYSQAEMKEFGKASAIVMAPSFELDFSNLPSLERKIKMLVTFS